MCDVSNPADIGSPNYSKPFTSSRQRLGLPLRPSGYVTFKNHERRQLTDFYINQKSVQWAPSETGEERERKYLIKSFIVTLCAYSLVHTYGCFQVFPPVTKLVIQLHTSDRFFDNVTKLKKSFGA